ncbi:MAG TPA: hypothetical protein VJ596_01675 [Gemmatimonadaceae bacterium]|nr:hypothetical protein [Gemmatimonadaceae bacterium]
MRTRACPACAREVAPGVTSCAHCGAVVPSEKPVQNAIFMWLAVIALAMLLIYMFLLS